VLQVDLIQTLAFAGLVLFLGHGIRRLVPVLARYNIPAPVVGGLVVATVFALTRSTIIAQTDGKHDALIKFDTTLQAPLMTAFFTSIGFGASHALLKKGGAAVVVFFLAATVVAVLQNVLGSAMSLAIGQNPLLGVLAGSVTLTGGPATGLAFAPMFETAGVKNAEVLAVAAAMVGIVSGGLMGGPIGTFLIERGRRRIAVEAPPHAPEAEAVGDLGGAAALLRARPGSGNPARATTERAEHFVEQIVPEPVQETPPREDVEAYGLLKTLVLVLVAMGVGSYVSRWLTSPEFTLPGYIGAMLVAAAIRNLDDVTGIFGISQRTMDDLGSVALSLFLAMALMTLKVWQIGGLAGPLLVMLAGQVALIALLCIWVIPRLMGRDYEGAVISSGFCGFMLGTTANAMANMEALAQRYGPAPKAFLIVPIVGAFLIDFTNALIITGFVNALK
jgi:ESS family glutamate:Na+ symporter